MAHRAYPKMEFRSCCVRELFRDCKEMGVQIANLPLINGHREKRWTENGPSQDQLDNFLMSGATFNDLIPELTPVMGEPLYASSPKRLKGYNDLEVSQVIRFMDPLEIMIPDEQVSPPHKDGGIVTMNGFATGLLKIAGRIHESSAESEIRVCRKRSTGPRKQKPDRSSGVSRRKRFIYTEDQTMFLEQMFALGRYAGHSERVTYASIIGVSEHRILVWFQNRRARENRIQPRQATKMHHVVIEG